MGPRLPRLAWPPPLRRAAIALGRLTQGRLSRAGTSLAVLGGVAWLVGWRAGWQEMHVVAGACLCLLAAALAWTIGRIRLDVELRLEPLRCVVGERAVAEVTALNPGPRRMMGLRLEVPIGRGLAETRVPSLAAGTSHSEMFVVPTRRRAVVHVGPARSVRSDPLGLARREMALSGALELFVHPLTVVPPGLAVGWIRDLEGLTTRDLSPSDLAFHTLRDYAPGDDLRHVHWRSSARHGRLMVRQYHDTRRSVVGLGLSLGDDDFATPDEFELAVSVTGSIGRGALGSSQQVRAAAGPHALPGESVVAMLDALAGVATSPDAGVGAVTRRLLQEVDTLNVGFVVVGSTTPVAQLVGARRFFPPSVAVVGVRCHVEAPSSVRRHGPITLMTVGRLGDLGAMVDSMVMAG